MGRLSPGLEFLIKEWTMRKSNPEPTQKESGFIDEKKPHQIIVGDRKVQVVCRRPHHATHDEGK